MSVINLLGFENVEAGKPFLRYSFDPTSGKRSTEPFATLQEASAGCCGYGDARQIGVKRVETVFVALYVAGPTLHFMVWPHMFEWPGSFSVTRKSLLGQYQKFTIKQGPRTLLSFWYRFVDSSFGFPGPEAHDIFLHLVWLMRDPKRLKAFLYQWNESARGIDVHTMEFRRHLGEAVKS